jgi:choline dehydrogenase-like flavoprotein
MFVSERNNRQFLDAASASLVESYVSGTRFVGTAMMGTSEKSAVGNTDTKALGTDNLFVVDARFVPISHCSNGLCQPRLCPNLCRAN